VWRFVDHRDGVVMKEDVLRVKRRELGTCLRDGELRLIILNLYRDREWHIVQSLQPVHVHPTKIKALLPRAWFNMRKALLKELKE
jgi:hypothetical protein